jgi:hypothetical protein
LWFLDLKNGGCEDKLPTSQGTGQEIQSEHSIGMQNRKHQKKEFGREFDAERIDSSMMHRRHDSRQRESSGATSEA